MIVVMESDAPESVVETVISHLVRAGCDVHRSSGQSRTILGVVGKVTQNDIAVIDELEGVARVVRVSEPYKLASRLFRQHPTVVDGEWGRIGGEKPWIALEPIGLGDPDRGASQLAYAVRAGRPFDAAITRAAQAPDSVGALACLSVHPKPEANRWPLVFVGREPSASLDAWIGAADLELERGAHRVVLLDAGTQLGGGERLFDVSMIAKARAATHLPIVVDVPTVAGRARYTAAIASAAVAAGASGLILRAWIGDRESLPRMPAALEWDRAVELAERARAIGDAAK
jgi:3-deoxy-7-phosphoheptulonate synthase